MPTTRQKRKTPRKSQKYSTAVTSRDSTVQVGFSRGPSWKIYDMVLKTDEFALNTGATTSISVVLNINNPNLVTTVSATTYGVTDWSSCVNLFDMYRVRRAKVVYRTNVAQTNAALGNMVVLFDPDNTTSVVSTSAQALGYADCTAFSPGKDWIYSVDNVPQIINAVAGGGWLDTGATANNNGVVQIFSSGLTTTTIYGTCFVELDIQFRVRR